MTTVYLAEKPDQAKKYAAAFQTSSRKDGYIECSDPQLGRAVITWAVGHLVELVEPGDYNPSWKKWSLKNLPMVPDRVKYKVAKGKFKQFSAVKKQLQAADTIVWAGDIDREGSLISYLICLLAGVWNKPGKTYKRLWITDLLPKTVRQGMLNLRPIEASYLQAIEAQSRQIGDWLVGMNASPLFTLTMKERGVGGTYAIGRVMTPTLYMIYQREQEIANFKQETYFEIEAEFDHPNGRYHGKLQVPEHLKDKWDGRAKSIEQARNVIKHLIQDFHNGTVVSVSTDRKSIPSPKLYQLSTLQTKMNRMMKASPAATLKAVQKLYDSQLLTYPRTDIPVIGQGRFEIIRDNMQAYASTLGYKGPLPNTRPNKRYVDDSKVAEHEAITPTEKMATAARLEKMSPLEKAVYLEVVRNTLAMFAPRYEYDETTIITAMPDVEFKSTGKVPISKGWHELWPTWKDEVSEILPSVQGGDVVKAQLMPIEKQTQPPKRYTEGTLLIAMKTAGKTTDDEESQTILKNVEGLGTEATRANVIEKLKTKDKTGNAFITVKHNAIYMAPKGNTICQAIATTPLLSSAEMTAQWEKFLKRIGKGQKQQEEFVMGITKFLEGLVHDVPDQLSNVKFDGAVALEKPHEPVAIGTCPKCGGKVMMLSTVSKCENNKRGKAGTCDFKLSNVVAGKKLSAAVMKELLRTGATAKKVAGFKSKKGKSFSAKLVLKQNEIQFDFD